VLRCLPGPVLRLLDANERCSRSGVRQGEARVLGRECCAKRFLTRPSMLCYAHGNTEALKGFPGNVRKSSGNPTS
jgi:hypothetical protein